MTTLQAILTTRRIFCFHTERKLNLTHRQLTPAHIDQILKICALQKSCKGNIILFPWADVRILLLGGNALGRKGMQALCSGDLANICELELDETEIDGMSLKIMFLANLGSMKILSMAKNSLADDGMDVLGQLTMANLTTLNLEDNGISPEGMEMLVKGQWRQLTSINISKNKIGNLGLRHFSNSDWTCLAKLKANQNGISSGGAYELTRASLGELTSLQLDNNKLGHGGIDFLSRGNWRKLQSLSLVSNDLTYMDTRAIFKSNWISLSELQIDDNANVKIFSDILRKQLKTRFTNLLLVCPSPTA